jgi:hypothetical protein
VHSCTKEQKEALRGVHAAIVATPAEVTIRLQPKPSFDGAGGSRPSQETLQFLSPSKGLVDVGDGWPASEDEDPPHWGSVQADLASGRHVEQEDKGKKRKLERHYLDRGVLRHIGILKSSRVSDALYCDFVPTCQGWPPIMSHCVWLLGDNLSLDLH